MRANDLQMLLATIPVIVSGLFFVFALWMRAYPKKPKSRWEPEYDPTSYPAKEPRRVEKVNPERDADPAIKVLSKPGDRR